MVDNPYPILSKEMGLEWIFVGDDVCAYFSDNYYYSHNDWPFFGLVWSWSQEQDWWDEFVSNHAYVSTASGYDSNTGSYETRTEYIDASIIHPTRFPEAVEAFLKERQ